METNFIKKTGKLTIMILVFLLATTSALFAQENTRERCSDGIDNDGDGFIDCYDRDCSQFDVCEDFFMNDGAECEVGPTEFPNFDIREVYKSGAGTASNRSVVVVGDILGDKTPEVVVANTQLGANNSLTILSGTDLSTINTVLVGAMEWQEYIALGKIDDPDCGWIFLSTGRRIIAYDCNLVKQWETGVGGVDAVYNSGTGTIGARHSGPIHLADFNMDGKAELYYRNEIRDAETGQLLVKGTGNWLNGVPAGSVAADIDPASPGLELIIGLTIYRMNATGTNWTLTELRKNTEYYPFASFSGTENHNFTSLADWDGNGELDIVANGSITSSTGDPTVFLWLNPMSASPELKKFTFDSDDPDSDYYKELAPNGTGIVNIANIDDVPGLNCTFAVKTHVYALNENFEFKWSLPILEKSSGNTGTTVFDFNSDGQNEIVYRDENYLHIIQDVAGVGTIRSKFLCGSQTGREYPVVADVNGDGETEIVVSCAASDNFTIGSTPSTQSNGAVKMFASLDEKWVRARSVWNQHGYFNVNINDDLTVPRQQQKHFLAFSNTNCNTGQPGAVRPLNSFLNQSPYLKNNGCPSYASPDLTFDDSSVQINPPTCPNTDFTLSFRLINQGDLPVNKKLYVSFYDGVPLADFSNRLNMDSVEIVNLQPDDTVLLENLRVTGTGGSFTLYVRFNDPKTISECDEDNNMFSRTITPRPFPIEVIKISDNHKCVDSLPDNGSARAYAMPGQVTTGYTFNWYKRVGGVFNTTPDHTGSLYTGMDDGEYRITAIHNLKQCASIATSVVIIDLIDEPNETLVIDQLSPFSSCNTPDGVLKATVSIDGTVQNPDDYSFQWFENTQFGTGNVIDLDDTAENLLDRNYKVDITNITTGCMVSGSKTVESIAERPELTAFNITHIDKCGDRGAITVSQARTNLQSSINTSSALTYRWYNNVDTLGARMPGETTRTISNLFGGTYAVVGVLNSNGCPSIPNAVTVNDLSVVPNITVAVTPNTSCNATVNGSISIQYHDNQPPQYNIKVYSWNLNTNSWNTTPMNGGSGTNLRRNDPPLVYGQLDTLNYRIVGRHNAADCFDQIVKVNHEPGSLDDNLIDITPVAQTNCGGTPNGSLSATYNGVTNDYVFKWYNGSSKKLNPDYQGSTYNNRATGDYTLVVVDAVTSCESPAVQEEVPLNEDLPQITVTKTNNTSCGAPNGTALATASSIVNPALGYHFDWRDGDVDTTVIAANRTGNVGLQATGLGVDSGNKSYLIRVTNRSNQCISTATVDINAVYDIPSIQVNNITRTANINCTGTGTGSLNATTAVTGNASEYEFYWYAPDGTRLPETGPVLSAVRGGAYQLAVRKISSDCMSPTRVTINVDDDFNYPTVSLNVTHEQTSCDETAPNGELTATASMPIEPTLGYQFIWYDNASAELANVDNIISPASDILGSILEGTYTVRAINKNTGCYNDSTKYLPKNIVIPDPDDATLVIQPNKNCSAPFTGSIQVSMPDPQPSLGYTYEWYTMAGVSIGTGDVIDELNAGFYQLEVIDNYTQCVSVNKKPVEVTNDFEPMTVQIDIINHQTHCSSDITLHNGSLNATVAEPGNYTYAWRKGLSTSNPVIGTNPLIENLTNATYSIRVFNTDNRCFIDKDTLIEQRREYPVVTATSVPVTLCFPDFDGVAEAGIQGGNVTGHTFYWFDGPVIKATPDLTGPHIYIERPAGEYTVYAIVDSTQCRSSNTEVVTVDDHISEVTFTFSDITFPIHCQDTHGQIRITASAAGNPQFDFDWYNGQTQLLPVTEQATTDIRGGLYYGNYNFKVKNRIDGCISDTSMYLPFYGESTLKIDTVTNAQYCVEPFMGSIEFDLILSDSATAHSRTLGDFVYLLYDRVHEIGDTIPPIRTIIPVDDNPVLKFENLAAGFYTISVVENWSGVGCEERPMSETVEIGIDLPTVTPSVVLENYSCDPTRPNGILSATAQSNPGLDAHGYHFTWYKDNISSADSIGTWDIPYVLPMVGVTHNFENLSEGKYIVVAFNNESRCDAVDSIDLGKYQRDLAIRNVTSTPQDNCSPANGTLLVGEIREDNVHYPVFNYTLVLSSVAPPDSVTASTPGVPMVDLSAGDYVITAINDSTLCETTLDYTIAIDTISPLIVNTQLIHDQFCLPTTSGNGAIAVAINESLQASGNSANISGYTYEWFDVSAPTTPLSSTTHEITGLPSGSYMVRITDNDGKYQNCVSTRTFTVEENQPEIAITKITTTDQTDCVGDNGSVTVEEVTFNGITQSIPDTDYIIRLLETPTIDDHTFTRNAGTYQFIAIYDPFQCESAVKEAEIIETLPSYEIEFTAVPDFSCDNANGQGELTARVLQNGVENTDFTLNWYSATNSSIGSTATIQNLIDGTYYLAILDNTTIGLGCRDTSSYILRDEFKDIRIADSDIKDQDLCFPNGTAAIVTIEEDGVVTGNTYVYFLKDSDGNVVANPGTGSSLDPYTGLAEGNYILAATNNLTGCDSESLPISIQDISTDPVLNLAVIEIQYRKAPPATPSGELEAIATELDGTRDIDGNSIDDLYDFTWVHNADSVYYAATNTNGDNNLINAHRGRYYVTVRNQTSLCETTEWIDMPEVIQNPEILLSSTPSSNCIGTGTIDITSVTIAGLSQVYSDYDFDLYKDFVVDPPNLINTIDGSSAGSFTGLPSGVYYVIARHKTDGLVSLAVRIEIEDQSTSPLIQLIGYQPQRSFSSDVTRHNGSLEIAVDSYTTNKDPDKNDRYNVWWYHGQDETGTPLSSFNNQFSITGLTVGYYTVVVQDINTGCFHQATYYVEENLIQVNIITDAQPNTWCVGANGSMVAYVVNPNSTFEYKWYPLGGKLEDTPLYTGQFQSQKVPAGTYTVFAVDLQDLERYGEATVEVKDKLVSPEIVITELAPQVNCFVDRPTGALTAELPNHDQSYYSVSWYDQQNMANPVANNVWDMNRLAARPYVITVTHKITGCSAQSDPVMVSEQIVPIPAPTNFIVSHRTNCVTPNGEITTSVNGVTYNYVFSWFNGSSVKANPDRYGITINSLDVGNYTVTATSVVTGCISDPTTSAILDKTVIPELEFVVKNAKCQEPTGSIQLKFKNNVNVADIIWSDGYRLFPGHHLENQPSGVYEVTVITREECEVTEEVTIKPDIMVYNGVSANGDGLNDKFKVACIEDFENNNVKIFNRAGEQVYEANYYDNQGTYFDGYGNRGIYLGKPELPVGTYFYIIDLKDGSVPRTGYLELVR